MKRLILLILTVSLAAAAVAGCGGVPTIPRHDSSEITVLNPNNKPDALEDYTAKDLYELGYLYPDTLSEAGDSSDERHHFTADGDAVRELTVSHGTLEANDPVAKALTDAGFLEGELDGVKEITGTSWLTAKRLVEGIETRGLATTIGDEYYIVKFSFPADGETAKAQASGIEYGLYMRLIYE